MSPESTMNPLFRVIAVVLPLLMIVTCGKFISPKKPEQKKVESTLKEREWMVNTLPVKLQRAAPEVVLFGAVRAQDSARLSGSVTGQVLKVNVKPGDNVVQGAVLVELDDLDLQSMLTQRKAEVADAEAQIALERSRHAADKQSLRHEQQLLRLAEKTVTRNNKLRRNQAISQAIVDQALDARERQSLAVSARKAQVEQHPARLQQLQARLDRATIATKVAARDLAKTKVVAPFSGSVTQVMISPGDEVRPGVMMLELFNPNSLELVAQVPGRYLNLVKTALANKVNMEAVAAVDGVAVVGRLTRLSNASELGGVDGYFSIEQGNKALQAGRRVRFTFKLPEQDNVLVAPFSALYGMNRVYIRDGDRLKRMSVSLAGEISVDGVPHALLQSDTLKNEQILVVTQLPNALEGLKVTTAEEQQAKREAEKIEEANKAEQEDK